MAHDILSTVVRYLAWIRETLDAVGHAITMPTEACLFATDVFAPKLILRSLRLPTVKEICDARTLTASTLLGLVVILVVRYARSPWRKVPPGPRHLPIIGNTLQVMNKPWLLSKDCKERFGEIMYLDVVGQPTIVINGLKTAYEILERRASNYSDRPRFVMAQDILSNGLLFALMSYGDRWRRLRRAAHEALSKKALQSYHSIQTKEATILVSSLLSPSSSLYPHKQFHRLTASLIMSILYDHPTIMSEHDETVKAIEAYNVRVSHAVAPGANLLEIFPWMIHIPERFARWKREGLEQFHKDYAMFRGLLNQVRVHLTNGGNRPSFSANLLQNRERNRLSDLEMSFLVGQLHSAAAETTSTTLTWWVLAMIAFPYTQRKAQTELDIVVGRERMPILADAPNLPYLGAVIKETLRWRPVLPLGVPHVATEDDWYEGMFIPKGTILLANTVHCNHDRAIFGDDADKFRPERHLDDSGQLLAGPLETIQAGHVSFGFGRRICVGKDLALDTLFINMARILWAATLERARDENGKYVPLDTETLVDAGIITPPVPYDCVIRPRFTGMSSVLAEERERLEV